MSQLIVQAAGYLASLLLALSLLVTNDLRFRWLNTGGCLAFIVYGMLIHAFPIILTNGILFFINVFALVKIYRKQEDFDLLEFNPDASLIQKFLRFYETDIKTYFPNFQLTENKNDVRFVVLRDMVLANVFVATRTEDGTAVVRFNYTVPKFRDYKVGRFIFEKERDYLPSKGIRKLVYTEVANPGHREFLRRMGFQIEMMQGNECFVKNL
jgi:GNAT superfamily N-acetyltransferase